MDTHQGSSSVPKIVGAIVAILVCCACVLIVGAGVVLYRVSQQVPSEFPTMTTPFENTVTPQPTTEVNRPSTDSISTETIDTLNESSPPENDPYELACRLQAVCNVSNTVQAKPYKLGDKEK